ARAGSTSPAWPAASRRCWRSRRGCGPWDARPRTPGPPGPPAAFRPRAGSRCPGRRGRGPGREGGYSQGNSPCSTAADCTRRRSDPPARGEGDGDAVADDEVVEQADVHQRQRLLQARGDGAVGGAGFGAAAGVVVADDLRGGVVHQRAPDDLARVYLGAVHGAPEQLLETERAVAGVEEQDREDLVGVAAQALGEIAAGGAGVGQRLAALQPGGEEAVAQLQRRQQLAG